MLCVEIKHRIFIRNLTMQLVSEQIKRCSEISTGAHKPLHLKLHQFQTQIEGISNDDINTAPPTNRQRKNVLGVMHPKQVAYQNIFQGL